MTSILLLKSLCLERLVEYASNCNSNGSMAEDSVEEALSQGRVKYLRTVSGSRADMAFKIDFLVFAEEKHIVLLQVKAGSGLRHTQPVLDRDILSHLNREGFFVSRAVVHVSNPNEDLPFKALKNLLEHKSRIVKEVVV